MRTHRKREHIQDDHEGTSLRQLLKAVLYASHVGSTDENENRTSKFEPETGTETEDHNMIGRIQLT